MTGAVYVPVAKLLLVSKFSVSGVILVKPGPTFWAALRYALNLYGLLSVVSKSFFSPNIPVPSLKLASLVPSIFHLAAEGSHCSPKTTDQDAYATGSYSFPTRTIEFNLKVFILYLLHIKQILVKKSIFYIRRYRLFCGNPSIVFYRCLFQILTLGTYSKA